MRPRQMVSWSLQSRYSMPHIACSKRNATLQRQRQLVQKVCMRFATSTLGRATTYVDSLTSVGLVEIVVS